VSTLARCTQLLYLGGSIPNPHDYFQQHCILAWAASKSVLESAALPEKIRSKIFDATIETVLLYNADTWMMTEIFQQEIDAPR